MNCDQGKWELSFAEQMGDYPPHRYSFHCLESTFAFSDLSFVISASTFKGPLLILVEVSLNAHSLSYIVVELFSCIQQLYMFSLLTGLHVTHTDLAF